MPRVSFKPITWFRLKCTKWNVPRDELFRIVPSDFHSSLWKEEMKKTSVRNLEKFSCHEAFKCTTRLVWNKVAALKGVALKAGKSILGCRGLLRRVAAVSVESLLKCPFLQRLFIRKTRLLHALCAYVLLRKIKLFARLTKFS